MLAVVLAALCFSVGEGLRLLPLPHTPSTVAAGAEAGAAASGPGTLPQIQFKPGTLGLPPQAQKNPQYERTHWAPPAACSLSLPRHEIRRRSARWGVVIDLAASVPRPAGRAPPRTA